MRLSNCTLLALALLPSLAFGQAAATQPAAPAAKAPMLPPTPEQRKVMETISREPTDVASPKMDLRTSIDGQPNPNFGQPNASFLNAHKSFLARKEKPIGVLFLGDSITAGWNGASAIWKKYYAKYDAANFGIGGDRTQHVLWRIENGELDGISPKVVVLMIGTNNSGGSSAEQIASGVTKIVETIHVKLPQTKVLLLGIFPRNEKATDAKGNPNPVRTKLQQVNAIIAKLDDGKQTRYFEIWKQFLTEDGTLSREIMPDFLHPNAKGYQIWADSMQPLLDEMLK